MQMSRLNTALEHKDVKQLASLAHANKGVCGNLALPALYAHFTLLEKQALAEDLSSIASTLQNIAVAWERFNAKLASKTTARPIAPKKSAVVATAFDVQTFQALLSEIAQAAQQAEIDDQRMQTLTEMTPPPYQQSIRHILNAINDFEFDLAAEHIAQLQAQIQDGAH